MKTFRLTHILILLLGIAILIDTSVQLGRPNDEVVWEPATDDEGCCDSLPVDEIDHRVFTA
jgi:hypothetical protein